MYELPKGDAKVIPLYATKDLFLLPLLPVPFGRGALLALYEPARQTFRIVLSDRLPACGTEDRGETLVGEVSAVVYAG